MKSDFKEKDQLTGTMRLSFRLRNGGCLGNREAFFELLSSSVHTLFPVTARAFPTSTETLSVDRSSCQGEFPNRAFSS